VRLLHALAKTVASFDDPHLVSHAGLVPVMALAERAGLGELVAEHVRPAGDCGVNAYLKVPALVAGMASGADSIDDMDVLRHGAMSTLFGGIRAPSTLGSHLRSYNWGNVTWASPCRRDCARPGPPAACQAAARVRPDSAAYPGRLPDGRHTRQLLR
jgi:hypothetical protein